VSGRRGETEPAAGEDTRSYTAAQALLRQGRAGICDEQMQQVIDERTAEWHSVIES
jgi:hypothetical protein